ncbi:protein takeout-like [Maniola jurtina]|uniref:protein takeout-like n=1 Tax=Maniola jurtina TaxID=191418 RepID=UPI001E688ACA|nr:protein takeout-like [Maniola jurtina]
MQCVYWYTIFFVTVNYCAIAVADRFHGFKRPCKTTSPECLRRSLQAVLPDFVKGIPELGIPSLDPLKVQNIDFVLPGGITVEIKEGFTKGLRKCRVDSVRNIGGNQYEVKFHCNLLTKGKYRSKGQFLMFPIDGEGESKIKCKNLKVTCTFRIVTTTKPDGTQHFQIQDFKSSHDYEGRVTFHLTNLFKGNPEISQAVLKFLNENWRSVSEEFGGPFFEYGVISILNNIKKFLDIIPIDQLEAV